MATKAQRQIPKQTAPQKQESEVVGSIEQLARVLEDMPERAKPFEKLTVRELVTSLKPQIAALRKKNYADEEIVEMLQRYSGITLAVPTMRNYMQEHASPSDGAFGVAKPRRNKQTSEGTFSGTAIAAQPPGKNRANGLKKASAANQASESLSNSKAGSPRRRRKTDAQIADQAVKAT